jgi:hypothetical protein
MSVSAEATEKSDTTLWEDLVEALKVYDAGRAVEDLLTESLVDLSFRGSTLPAFRPALPIPAG